MIYINSNMKAYTLINKLCEEFPKFGEFISSNIKNGKIRFFSDEEWDKIDSQNFTPFSPNVQEFRDLFIQGYNIGSCVRTSWQLSYSYDNVDIVSGILPIIKGSLNAEKEGGHCWLETSTHIIDTSLMLIIDKSLKNEFGYIEESRITSYMLLGDPRYDSRKRFINDKHISKK